jgi:hypothetical protein
MFGNKKEEKILELLRKRVLEKDKELAHKEYLNATKEALVEMTTLSEAEVNEIYHQIENEIEAQKIKKRIIFFVSAIFLIFLIYYFSGIVLNMISGTSTKNEQKKLNEKWSIVNEDGSGFYIEDGFFIMDSKLDRGVHLISKDFDFPDDNFSIEFEAFNISSSNEIFFGIYLNESQYNFEYYLINNEGTYKIGRENQINNLSNNRIESNDFREWKNGRTIEYQYKKAKVNSVVIKIEKSTFEILVNNLKVCSFHNSYYYTNYKNFSLVLESTSNPNNESQKIAIDNFIIRDLKNNKILYQNTFDKEW